MTTTDDQAATRIRVGASVDDGMSDHTTTEGATMASTTTRETTGTFDLFDAVVAAFPALSEEDQLVLAVKIEQDAREYRDENIAPGCPAPDALLPEIQERMLECLVNQQKPPADAEGLIPGWPGTRLDLVAEIVEAVPCLEHEDAELVAPLVYRGLEVLVGERLTDGMPNEKLDEFGFFVDQDEDGMARWFAENLSDYESRDDFQALVAANPDADRLAVLSEYGAMRWLQRNRPDYPDVTKVCARRVITALQDAVIEVGSDGLDTWLRLRRTAWKWAFNKADNAEQVMACVAVIACKEGPDVFGLWAQTQSAFDSLSERATALDGEAA